jgi:hypothetical protein
MLADRFDRLEARLAPYAKPISIVAIIWFWVGVAVQARFIPLPDLPRPVDRALFWSGVAANALWWGWLRPAIERRRLAREQVQGDPSPPE